MAGVCPEGGFCIRSLDPLFVAQMDRGRGPSPHPGLVGFF